MRLGPQIDKLRNKIITSRLNPALLADLDVIQEDYNRLCAYALDGIEDPERNRILHDMQNSVTLLNQRLDRQISIQKAATLYFNTLRYRQAASTDLGYLLNRYSHVVQTHQLALQGNAPKGKILEMLKDIEEVEKQLFNLVWTEYPLTAIVEDQLNQAIEGDQIIEAGKLLIINALFMGLLEIRDDRRLMILASAYENLSLSDDIRIAALSGILLAVWMHKDDVLSSKVAARLETLSDVPGFAEDVRNLQLQYIRTRETARISVTLQQDIFPELKRFSQQMKDKSTDLNEITDLTNPDWQEHLESSGLDKKLKDLMDMQLDGVDVLMPMFKSLMHTPFFNDISNWFLPFRADHSVVQGLAVAKIGRVLEQMNNLCNTDRYAMSLAMEMMPEQQRDIVISQLNAQQVQDAIEQQDMLNTRNNIANRHVRDLNRFFSLFRRRGEFKNPFATPINLHLLPVFKDAFDDAETLKLVAEFYLKRNYYADALALFEMLLTYDEDHGDTYQKIGYCKEKLKQYSAAVEAYEKAEMLQGESLWVTRRKAVSQRACGNYRQAAELYQKLQDAKDEPDPGLELSIGHCYLALGENENAIKHYYKGEFLDEKTPERFLRPIAWAALMVGDLEKAGEYYDSILADGEKATASDLMNAGHLEAVKHNYRQAILLYRCAKQKDSDFTTSFAGDKKILIEHGVTPEMLDIIEDNL